MNMAAGSLLRQLEDLQRKLGSNNQPVGYAYVRDNFPELAKSMFSDRDLRNVDLRGADLMRLDFSRSDMTGSSFEDARIQGAQFHLTNVPRSELSRTRDWDQWRNDWVPTDWLGHELSVRRHVKDPKKPVFLSPWLPELWLVHPRDVVGFKDLPERERMAIETGRLALAAVPLTFEDFAHLLDTTLLSNATQDVATRPIYTVLSYCRQMTRQGTAYGLPAGTEVDLPSFALLDSVEGTLASRRAMKSVNRFIDSMPEFALDRDKEPAIVKIGGKGGSVFVGRSDRPASFRPVFLFGEDGR